MDSSLAAAAQALAAGDALGALKRVALRDEPPALALRGIALAQLGALAEARALLRRAERGFGRRHAVAQARCVVAQAEIALALRELGGDDAALDAARRTLQQSGDAANAAHVRLLQARRLLLLGRLDAADSLLSAFDPTAANSAVQAAHALACTGVAMRRQQGDAARAALNRAVAAAQAAAIPGLLAEVDAAARALREPVARRVLRGGSPLLSIDAVQALLAASALIVDARRLRLQAGATQLPLATRPLLFLLVRALAEAWPDDVPRAALITRAFRVRQGDDTHRARLRVEIGRLRKLLRPLVELQATLRGYTLVPRDADEVAVLVDPRDESHADLMALLADGEPWSSALLAHALDCSQRTVQRALDALAARGRVQALGRGRARRWIQAPAPGFATPMLLPQRVGEV